MKMLKKVFVAIVLICSINVLHAQTTRYAVINTKYILERIPEYKEADKKLKVLGDQWQSEIDEKQIALDKMYKNYDAEQFMLSDDLKKKREEET